MPFAFSILSFLPPVILSTDDLDIVLPVIAFCGLPFWTVPTFDLSRPVIFSYLHNNPLLEVL